MNTPLQKHKRITLREVAARAGIDKATASRALNGKGYISPQTREAALKAARELGFRPDLLAQRLAKGRAQRLVALFAESDLGVGTQQTWALTHRLDERKYDVESLDIPMYVSDQRRKQVVMVNKICRQRPSAIITETSMVEEAIGELQAYQAEGGIVVTYGARCVLTCDQVVFDRAQHVAQAVEHLVALGHRTIGLCLHGPLTPDSDELQGFRQALGKHGLRFNEGWLFAGGNYEEGGARLAESFVTWDEKPTALCIVNDVSASAFITVLAQRGLSVPQLVSVVGFDDVQAARYALVPITSVSYPLESIADHVVELVHSRLEGFHGAPRQVHVEGTLAKRQSVRVLDVATHDAPSEKMPNDKMPIEKISVSA